MSKQPIPEEEEACVSLLKQLTLALEKHWIDFAVYPRSGNANLVRRLQKPHPNLSSYYHFPKGSISPRGEVIDPWGRPLVYQNRTDRGSLSGIVEVPRGSFLLYSRGPDGRKRIQLEQPPKRS